MSAAQVIADLYRRGVSLRADGSNLFARGPRQALTYGVLSELRRQKAELLRELEPPTRPVIYVYRYRIAQSDDWIVLRTPEANIGAVRRSLEARFGQQLIGLAPHWRPEKGY